MTSPTTTSFMRDVCWLIDFTYGPRRTADRIAAADRLIRAIDERDTYHLVGIKPDEITVTAEQWTELRRMAGLTAASHRAES